MHRSHARASTLACPVRALAFLRTFPREGHGVFSSFSCMCETGGYTQDELRCAGRSLDAIAFWLKLS
eukprot:12883073-Alexandrium_andersonii.AAC.1